jgi:glycosyltransferase involved in cell wall biosynthesis
VSFLYSLDRNSGTAPTGDALRVVSCHDGDANWPWIAPLYRGEPKIEWTSISTVRRSRAEHLPGLHFGRVRAAFEVRKLLRDGKAELIVSHGPYTSHYIEAIGRPRGHRHVPHLAFAFNFTDLPDGWRLSAMRRTFGRTDILVTSSEFERNLYAEYFGIPTDRFTFLRWGVAPPIIKPDNRSITGPYVVALGGEARDYKTLCEAAHEIPEVRFVLIIRPHSLADIEVPDNVTVHVNASWQTSWSLVWHAELALLPLRSDRSPNGLVTLVGAMHLGKAQVVTNSVALHDYVEDGQNARLVPANDPRAFAQVISQLLANDAERERLGANARAFARGYCSESATVEGFRRLAIELTGRTI